MNEKLQKVIDLLEQNEELKEKYYANPPKTSEEFIAAAKELGVELTKDDLEFPTIELKDDELEQVAGGFDKDYVWENCKVGATFGCTISFGSTYYLD